jgi:hypothetical protein
MESGGFQGHTQIAIVKVADFEEASVAVGGFVDSEIFHHAKRGRTLERTRERAVAVEEAG